MSARRPYAEKEEPVTKEIGAVVTFLNPFFHLNDEIHCRIY